MRRHYSFPRLSRSEQLFLEAVLLDEMDFQKWYAVSYIRALREEVFLLLQ